MSLESKIETAENLFKNHKESEEQSPVQHVIENQKNDSCIVLPNIRGTYLSASAAVEAALVMPIFIYAVMAVMYIMQMILVQIQVQESLYNAGRQIAKYAYLYDCIDKGMNERGDISRTDEQNISWFEKGISVVGVQAAFVREIGTGYADKAGIVGGNAGYVMLGSKIMEGSKDIILNVSYVLKNPFDIFGIAVKKFTQQVSVTAWLGDDKCMGVEGDDTLTHNNQEYVYLTTFGEVYHTDKGCTYLKPAVRRIKRENILNERNENGAKYYECEYCTKRAKETDSIYITSYGNRWHVTDKCPKINRSIMKVLKSSVADMRKCSKCGEK